MSRSLRSLVVLLVMGAAVPALAAAPTVSTQSATSVTATTAVLNGLTNPNGESTIGWFRHSTTSPGTCNDSFGSRVPGTGGTAVGNGSTNTPYSVSTSGLLPGSTYYYCAIVENPSGMVFGAISSFSTPAQLPTVGTSAATSVTSSTAVLNGSANPNGSATTGYFRFHTSSGTCSNSFGTRVPLVSGGSSLGSGNATLSFTDTITGLLSGATYYYCAVAVNGVGTTYGNMLSFTTLVAAPAVTTNGASSVTGSSATLSGTANPNGAFTQAWFRYSASNPGGCNDAFGTRLPVTPGTGTNMGSGSFAQSYSLGATGLTNGTTYWFCAIASNSEGTTLGTLQTFTTPAAPSVTTQLASSVTSFGATLNSTANPNGSNTTGWVRYSQTDPGACSDSFGTRLPAFSGGAPLSSGNAPVNYSQVTGTLLPGTTYYHCSIASNGVGTSFGQVLSFTTPPAVPAVSTNSPTLITGSSATLNGTVTARGASTNAWFRFDTVNPGSCNNTFGVRAPSTGGSDVGSANSATSYSELLAGLLPGTTYYVCAIAQNSVGFGYGNVVSFLTHNLPTVTTSAATVLGNGSSANLNGYADPKGEATIGWFRMSTIDPGSCNDTFGARVPFATGSGTDVGSGTGAVFYDEALTTLSPGTTYYFCAIAQNTVGTGFGTILNFTTPAVPTVNTLAATAVGPTVATLQGSANPNRASTTAWFRYSGTTGTCSDTFGTRVPTTAINLSSGSTVVPYSTSIGGLLPGKTYFYCAIATNSVGTSYGPVLSFTAPATAPIVYSDFATLITGTTATLNGEADPRGAVTTGWFRFSNASPGSCNDTFGTRVPLNGGTDLGGGNVSIAFDEALTGLTPGTLYYFCAIASNSVGTTPGNIYSFTTPNVPTVTTVAANIGSNGTTATLNGNANPRGAQTTGYYRYDTVNPVTCDDNFGTRYPTTGGTNLSSGNSAVSFPMAISGLTPGTQYYYCALATNLVGTGVGTVLSFTTPAAPTVTTVAADNVTATSARLNATGIPNGASTTGWFRYHTAAPPSCNDTFGTRAPLGVGTGNSLGGGNSSVPFSLTPANLNPGVTYYYCAIATNSVGTTFGAVLSFTTPALPPSVTTSTVTGVTSSTATLNGNVTANGAATTGWFRYSTIDPVTCNDGFGTRAPATGTHPLGAANTATNYSESLTGLALATTYYYCAIATNSQGTTFGGVVAFTTSPTAPTVTTLPPTGVTTTAASMNADGNPNGAATTGWFRYSSVNPVTCNDTFGTRAPLGAGTGNTLGGGKSNVPYSLTPNTLSPGVTYYFCAIASNSVGTSFGQVLSFTTASQQPTIDTLAASNITGTSAQLNGSSNPNGDSATAYFRIATASPGSCNDTFGTVQPAAGLPLGNGTTPVSFNQPLTGLTPGTTYFFCAISSNALGKVFGLVLQFATPAAPVVTTAAASPVTASSATLNATAIPGGTPAGGWFRYSTTLPASCDDSFGVRAPAGTATVSLGQGASSIPYQQSISGLQPGTAYYFCAIASNSVGTSFGQVLSFTTPPTAPTVQTLAASAITSTSATLNASSNPNGATSTGWFRFHTVSPGSCNDSFGTRAPVGTGASALGAGTTTVNWSQTVTSLSPGTTYFYCPIANNAVGTNLGGVLTFTTLAAPTTTTLAASGITTTTATLNGSSDPNGADTTAWYRFDTVNPGSCNDTFGTRAPLSGAANVGNGTAAVQFPEPLTGLSPGTTYFYCAISENSVGKTFGVPAFFTTLTAPTVVTQAPSVINSTSATLSGTVNPNGAASLGWFRYFTTNPGTCTDSGGLRAPTTAGTGTSVPAGNSPVTFTQPTGTLTPSTTYFVCAFASNSSGTSAGQVVSFTTVAVPTTTSLAATSVGNVSAQLNGTANPNLAATTGFFRYSTAFASTCTGTYGTRFPATGGTTLGAGNTAAPFNELVAGLAQATTYYYCAAANNSAGTTYGAVMTFTTSAAPTAVTNAASSVNSTQATLNGSSNPRGDAATAWFRFDTVSPGSCNDSFGTRMPSGTGGSPLGAGNSAVAFLEIVTGLTAGQTYYYCAISQNAWGTTFGAVSSFTTPTAPSVTTLAATSISAGSATLNGNGTANNGATTGYYRYDTTNPTTCNDTFGTRAPLSGGTSLGSGTTSTSFPIVVSGLASSTTYFFCAIANNVAGTSFGSVLSFTTPAAPSVTTLAPTNVLTTSATLQGTANPNGTAALGWFRYSTVSPTTCNDTFGFRIPTTSGTGTALGNGTSAAPYSASVTGLTSGVTYYYCALASNASGTAVGQILSFTTNSAPAVTTVAASNVANNGASMNGTADPRGLVTTAFFRYSQFSGTCTTTYGTRFPATGGTTINPGSGVTPFSQTISGLAASTTYFYCAQATNSLGTSVGTLMSFTTSAAPLVTSLAASSVSTTTATLNGQANPRGNATTGWYRYATTSPGTCNDTFGTRFPATGGTPLGAGSTVTPFPENVTGLLPATTYYFCALASNTFGTAAGTVLSFNTTGAPGVTTSAASALTATSAQLNGQGDPNGLTATGWFRYSVTDPGTCDDVFGTRAPLTSGTSLGAGTTALTFAQTASGLTSGTTYYYCAIASNSEGTSFGSIQSFTTPAAPTVTTLAANALSATAATLNGSVHPRGLATLGWYRFSVTDPGVCSDTVGTRAPATGGTSVTASSGATPMPQPISGLLPGTTYFFCALASNSLGVSAGPVLSFTTPATTPSVTTLAATAVSGTSATLEGQATPNGANATGWFRYSTTSPGGCNDSFGTRAPTSSGTPLGSGNSPVSYAETVSGLTTATTYYYCALASSSAGTAAGPVLSFTTPGAPTVTTGTASSVTTTAALLNGSAIPNGSATNGWLRYGTTNPGTCSDTFGTRLPSSGGTILGAGFSSVTYSQSVSGLTAGTTYYFCAVASNSVATSFGAVVSFTTPIAPTVTTVAATSVTSTTATLNANANPGGAAATGWFRYSVTNPGACSDSFGTRAPLSGGTNLGSGASATPYTQALTGLSPGAVYYFCAIASNSVGTSFGTVLSFTMQATTPQVTTSSATLVTGTSATLNGSGNPGGGSATGWFRYSAANPGSCNDTFGARTPATGGTSLGSGNAAIAFNAAITALTPATQYFFCAIASNAIGTATGAVLSFTTPGAPSVVTSSASSVGSTAATLNGSANPNRAATTGWLRFDTTNPGTCNDTFGTRLPATGGTTLGAGTSPLGYSQPATGLQPGRTYYFCAIAANVVGTSFGQMLSFTVTAPAPTVTTLAASNVEARGALLNGTATPNQTDTVGWFRYDTVQPPECNDTFGTRAPGTTGLPLGSGVGTSPYSVAITGLQPNATYFFCAIASNTGGAAFGQLLSFKTPAAAPTVTTLAATNVVEGGGILNGTVNPNGLPVTAWFQYGTTNPGTCTDSFGTRSDLTQVPAGGQDSLFSRSVVGLSSGTYYYCAVAFTSAGTTFGQVLTVDIEGANAGGCGCSSSSASSLGLLFAGLAFAMAARRRRSTVKP